MGQTVFVLSTLIGNEQRPSAVVTSEYSADQWVKSGNDNDWISFELDDLSLTGMADKGVTTFKPKPMPKIDDAEKMRRDTIKTLTDSNAQLQKTVESLIEKVKQLQGKKKGTFENPLLHPKRALFDDKVTHLYHGTSVNAHGQIMATGGFMKAPSYWGTPEIAEYYAEVVAEEDGSEQVILELPISAFNVAALVPDQNSIAEPLTYTLGRKEEELFTEWEGSDGTWEDSLEIYGSVRYNAAIDISKAELT